MNDERQSVTRGEGEYLGALAARRARRNPVVIEIVRGVLAEKSERGLKSDVSTFCPRPLVLRAISAASTP